MLGIGKYLIVVGCFLNIFDVVDMRIEICDLLLGLICVGDGNVGDKVV